MNNRCLCYRGIVVNNQDPLYKGRVKIFVPGVYPLEFKDKWQKLPWAQPALLIGGGNWINQKFAMAPQSVLAAVADQVTIMPQASGGGGAGGAEGGAEGAAEGGEEGAEAAEEGAEQAQEDAGGTHQKALQLNMETGWCSVPHAGKLAKDGAQVWVFFESGNINKPIYFAAAQSGTGWFSEHANQHVFHSDNIRVRIDENPYRKQSTCFFTTYNQNINKEKLQTGGGGQAGGIPLMQPVELQPTVEDPGWESKLTQVAPKKAKLDIEILESNFIQGGQIAVNLKVTGHVNVNILGDIYLQHTGNKYETHIGDHYLHHIGNTFVTHQGDMNYQHIGELLHSHIGDSQKNQIGDLIDVYQGKLNYQRTGDQNIFITGNQKNTLTGNREQKIMGKETRTVMGPVEQKFLAAFTKTVGGNSTFTSTIINWTLQKLFFK